MNDVLPFGAIVLGCAAVGLLAVLSNRVSERLQVPTPVFFLVGAAIAADVVPMLGRVPPRTVERVVMVALVVILFDGGMHIGWARFRAAIAPILVVGVLGTFLTAAAVAALAHLALGLSWWLALLVGTAVAPTDPAVVFSVLGRREVGGRSGTILEGESGANDPVGIALMAGLLGAGGVSASALGSVAAAFVAQMVVGAVIGVVGGRTLLWSMRRLPLPSEGLYPLRTLFGAMAVFGIATVAHGSGFLAVLVAGILLGDARAPYKREIERFHAALASLGEIVAFVVLGITIHVPNLARTDVWAAGLLVGAVLAFVIRPLLVGVCLLPFRLRRNEQAFVLWAGLKGAVPILLASYLLGADLPDPQRLFGIVVVVVMFSVLVQGGTVPLAARLLRVPMRVVEPEPWALGVRLRDEPRGVHRYRVAPGAAADDSTIEDLVGRSEDLWISFVIRSAELVPVRGDTRLKAGDEVLVLAPADLEDELTAAFTRPEPVDPGD